MGVAVSYLVADMNNDTDTPLIVPINKDVVAGAIFVAFALGFGVISTNYQMGSLAQMGPGYYPALLSAILAGFGIAIGIAGLRKGSEKIVAVRPLALIAVLGSPLLFAATVRSLGFVPAVILTSLVATIAAPKMTLIQRLGATAILTLGCTAIFIWALGIPLPLLGGWLTF